MRLPILIEDPGSGFEVYYSLEEAESSLEPPDVQDGANLAYDAARTALEIRVEKRKEFLFTNEIVRIMERPGAESRADELRAKLADYLARLSEHFSADDLRRRLIDVSSIESATLDGLIARLSILSASPRERPVVRDFFRRFDGELGQESSTSDERVFLPQRGKWLAVAILASSAAVGLLIFATLTSDTGVVQPLASERHAMKVIYHLAAASFFCIFLFGVAQLLPGSSFLRAGRDGIVDRWLWRTRTYRWSDIDSFVVKNGRTVAFNFSRLCSGPRPSRLRRSVFGFDRELHDNFGISAGLLAGYLNWRRERCSSLSEESHSA
ncbi:MAG TPA: hypothetical protein VKU82_11490 [Planctomycetaceae bacterium]|nr:hypothetical protein [Planctomycetaceae bacterium]